MLARDFQPPQTVDRPFGLPAIVTVLDLPIPPSVNRIWQHKKAGKKQVFMAPEYRRWIKQADMCVLATAQLRGVKRIDGLFEAEIALQRTAGDLDNRIKAVLDYAQSRALIANDKNCERVTAFWGEAPRGCRLTLKEIAA